MSREENASFKCWAQKIYWLPIFDTTVRLFQNWYNQQY